MTSAEELKELRRVIALAEKAAGFGIWYSDPGDAGKLIWSEGTYRIFGHTKATFDGRVETFFDMVHPDDLESVRKASGDALAGRAKYDVEHRIVRPDGQVRWVHQVAEVVLGDDGSPLQMIGMAQDITSQKGANEVLVEAARDLKLRNDELEKMLKLTAGRENRMVELKQEIDRLKKDRKRR